MTVTQTQPHTVDCAYRVRLRPTRVQEEKLLAILDARLWTWNWAVDYAARILRTHGKHVTWIALSGEFTRVRKEVPWLRSIAREPLQQTLRDFGHAQKNYYAGWARPPKRKRMVRTFRCMLDQRRAGDGQQVDRLRGSVSFPGLDRGRIRFRVTQPIVGRLRNVTVIHDTAGRWYASFSADGVTPRAAPPAARVALGIDLGLVRLATCSDGSHETTSSRHFDRRKKQLRRAQRKYMRQRDAALTRMGIDPRKRQPKGIIVPESRRMLITKRRIGTLYARISDATRDQRHQLTTAAVRRSQIVCIEDLDVRAISRALNRAFRRSASHAAMGNIRRLLRYKSAWYGRTLVVVDRFFPSSKLCSRCGKKNITLQMRDRVWSCDSCGTQHDRDHNAAINIEREGLRLVTPEEYPEERGN